MKITVVKIEDLTTIIAGLVREGIHFSCEAADDSASMWIVTCTGGY